MGLFILSLLSQRGWGVDHSPLFLHKMVAAPFLRCPAAQSKEYTVPKLVPSPYINLRSPFVNEISAGQAAALHCGTVVQLPFSLHVITSVLRPLENENPS